MADEHNLFPGLPDDLKALPDEDITALVVSYEESIEKINRDGDKSLSDDELAEIADFLGDLEGNEIIGQLEAGVNEIKLLRDEQAERVGAHEAFQQKKAELVGQLEPAEEEVEEEEVEEAPVEVEAEAEEVVEEEEKVLVTASVDTSSDTTQSVRFSRRPPAPAPEREPTPIAQNTGTALVAAGTYRADYPTSLDPDSLALLVRDVSADLGPLPHNEKPGKYVTELDPLQINVYADGRREEIGAGRKIIWDGPKTKVARAETEFPEERTFNGSDDYDKIRAVLPSNVKFLGKNGEHGGEALVASGGLCAPLTPIYSMPNFGTEAEPVWDALPVFRAARGGVNVPEATYVADITTAISSISEANDALGGTYATKSCQDLTCPAYTETAVNIFAHCREYGNLNARAWPEKIAHENALTMQALSRTSEDFMLERIKALSVNVTDGIETLGALIYLVNAIVLSAFGIRGRLRMPAGARFRALLPDYALDLLVLDNIQTQFDRFRTRGELDAYLRSVGIDPVYYIDGNFAAGDDQLPDASQGAGALDGFPNTVQWAIYPEGAFLGIDSGVLELGIVRDSVLNSTNDFQVFGERFRNLVRLAPAQACHWHTTDWCPVGSFPPAGTARTCE